MRPFAEGTPVRAGTGARGTGPGLDGGVRQTRRAQAHEHQEAARLAPALVSPRQQDGAMCCRVHSVAPSGRRTASAWFRDAQRRPLGVRLSHGDSAEPRPYAPGRSDDRGPGHVAALASGRTPGITRDRS